MWSKVLGSACLAASVWVLATTAHAVTVDVDVVSKGEPVPGTTITFETADGTAVPIEPAEPDASETTPTDSATATEKPSDPAATEPVPQPQTVTSTEEANAGTPEEPAGVSAGEIVEQAESAAPAERDDEEDATSSAHAIRLPDSLIGKDLVLVVRKDGEIVKRQPVKLDSDTQRIPVTAFDPADAAIAIALRQKENCKSGRKCDLEIEIANRGNGIYKGPLFLQGDFAGALSAAADKEGLSCDTGGGDDPLCHVMVSLEPGEVLKWPLNVSLPVKPRRAASNCVDLTRPIALESGPGSLIQAIQLGLQMKGFSKGRADGKPGPKTLEAIAKFKEQANATGETDYAELYKQLYGQEPADIQRLGVEAGQSCQTVRLVKQPAAAKKEPAAKKSVAAPKKEKATSQKTGSQTKKQRTKTTNADGGSIGVVGGSIGFGIGGGSGSRGGKDSHRRKKRKIEQQEHPDE